MSIFNNNNNNNNIKKKQKLIMCRRIASIGYMQTDEMTNYISKYNKLAQQMKYNWVEEEIQRQLRKGLKLGLVWF